MGKIPGRRRLVDTKEQTPKLFDNRGSLEQMPLANLLQSMQAQRATGTLQVRQGSETFALFFLFGHLFHAYGDGTQGEEAVFVPLTWQHGDYTFDPKSKLPAEETIKAPTPVTPNNSQPAPPSETSVSATELYPLPVGRLVYESLKTAFVDFPKLLRSLSADRLTGYLRLTGQASRGMILFYQGSLIESFYDGGAVVTTGRTAFTLYKNDVDRGEGTMDVIDLSPEVVTAIYQLLTAPTILQGLLSRFVDVKALLEYLQEEQLHGSLLARAPDEMGIIMLRGGHLLGAFTRSQPQLSAQADVVLALCKDPRTRIEVKAVADLEEPSSVNLEDMLSSPGMGHQPARSAPPPPVAQRPAYAPGPPAPHQAPPPVQAETDVDWEGLMNQLYALADESLGNRAKKVKEMLATTEPHLDALDRTIDRVSQTSIMFVDPARLANLADQMRQVV